MVVAVLYLQTFLGGLVIASGEHGHRSWSCGTKCDANINQGTIAAVRSFQAEHKMGRQTLMWGTQEEQEKWGSTLSD